MVISPEGQKETTMSLKSKHALWPTECTVVWIQCGCRAAQPRDHTQHSIGHRPSIRNYWGTAALEICKSLWYTNVPGSLPLRMGKWGHGPISAHDFVSNNRYRREWQERQIQHIDCKKHTMGNDQCGITKQQSKKKGQEPTALLSFKFTTGGSYKRNEWSPFSVLSLS